MIASHWRGGGGYQIWIRRGLKPSSLANSFLLVREGSSSCTSESGGVLEWCEVRHVRRTSCVNEGGGKAIGTCSNTRSRMSSCSRVALFLFFSLSVLSGGLAAECSLRGRFLLSRNVASNRSVGFPSRRASASRFRFFLFFLFSPPSRSSVRLRSLLSSPKLSAMSFSSCVSLPVRPQGLLVSSSRLLPSPESSTSTREHR